MKGRCRRWAERARVASSSINLRDTARGLDCCTPCSKHVAGHYSSVKPSRAPRASGWWLWWLVVAAPEHQRPCVALRSISDEADQLR